MGLRARGFRCGGHSVVFMSLSTLDETVDGVGLSVRGANAARSSEVREDMWLAHVPVPCCIIRAMKLAQVAQIAILTITPSSVFGNASLI